MAFKVGKHKKSSFNYNPAPLKINEEELIQKHLVSGILFNRKQAQISMMDIPHQPGIEGYILKAISDANILVDMITQTEKNSDTIDLTFTIPRMKCKKTLKVIQEMLPKLGQVSVTSHVNVAKLSLTGIGIRSHSNVAYTMFKALGDQGIIIKMITTSEIKISIIIDEKYLKIASHALRKAFDLGKFLLG